MKLISALRVKYNEILVRLGKRDILPVQSIRKVKVVESGEEMVELADTDFDFFDTCPRPAYLRKTPAHMLCQAAREFAKRGYRIKINSPYRGFDRQLASWNLRLEQTKQENPEASEEELIRLNMMRVAYPDPSNLDGGHLSGGAVDIALVRICDDEELDMGCGCCEHGPTTRTKCDGLTKQQKDNRAMLCQVMEEAGFTNYPAEWWHFCYGDNMWAAYNNKKTCPYGYAGDILQNQIGNRA